MPDAAAEVPAHLMSPSARAFAAIEAGRVPELDGALADTGATEPSGAAGIQPPAAPDATPDPAAQSIIERVRAKLAQPAPPTAPTQEPPREAPRAEPTVQGLTTEQLREKLSGSDALDFIIGELGIDPSKLVDGLVDQANAGPRQRATEQKLRDAQQELERLRGLADTSEKTSKKLDELDAWRQQQQQQALREDILDSVEDHADRFPLLAGCPVGDQVAYVARAARMITAAGESENAGWPEILELAQDELKRFLSRYPREGLGGGAQTPAVGAGNTGSSEPTTLQGSHGAERTQPGGPPERGTPEWYAYLETLVPEDFSG